MTRPHRPLGLATLSLVVAIALGSSTPIAAQTRPFTAGDMLGVVQISGSVAASPDGSLLAFVLPDLADEWNVAERRQVGMVHLLEVGTSPGTPTPIEGGGPRSSFPVFSPDGNRLAFFTEGSTGGKLAVLDIATGRVESFGTPFPGKANTAPRWATNHRVVYARPSVAAPVPEEPRIRVLEIDDPLPGDAYFRRDPRAGLRVVDLQAGTERALVEDGTPQGTLSISPDGRYVLGRLPGVGASQLWDLDASGESTDVGTRTDRPVWMADGRLLVQRPGMLGAISPTRPTGDPERLTSFETPLRGFTEAPDGAFFAGMQVDPSITDPEIEAPQRNMYTIARPYFDVMLMSAADGQTTNLTSDLADQVRALTWATDGASLFFVATDNVTYEETLYRYDVGTGERSVLDSGRQSFGSLIPVPSGVVASVQSATTPSDLWHFDASTGTRTRVTDLNPQLVAHTFSEPELFYFESLEGDRLGALLYRATGSGAASGSGTGSSAGEPVITYVYEKLTPGIHRFQPRHQIFATHGYAILMPNVMIRVGEPGTSYVSSVVPAIEAVRAMGFTNGKACMWGGSFGAYATSFAITQTNTFDCAVARATPPELFRNWASGRDRDSRNIESGQARMGGSPFEVQDRYLSQSAFFHLDQVETPVLITHGMKDYTILFEEGAMMFYALRQLGKEATFVSYREGDHSLYRHSRADALDVHQRMLDWFERYMR